MQNLKNNSGLAGARSSTFLSLRLKTEILTATGLRSISGDAYNIRRTCVPKDGIVASQKADFMSGESAHWEQKGKEPGQTSTSIQSQQQREQIFAAIALLLGPDTDYQKRQQAAQRLAKAGPEILPLLLHTLHICSEIVPPSWPLWPPQYEQTSRLLVQLSLSAQLSLVELLDYPSLTQPPGPVLWTSVVEAAGLLPHVEYEQLLRDALEAPWWTVRYAAAMTLSKRATHVALHPETYQKLYLLQNTDPEIPVRLTASCALLRSGDSHGLAALMDLLEPANSTETRRATLFILATELPVPLKAEQKQTLSRLLLRALQDEDQQIAHHAARALHTIATPEILSELNQLLEYSKTQTRIATLVAIEELASRQTIRYAIQQHLLTRQIAALLNTPEPDIRRQACYTLATLGGEYATAVLGTIILDDLHPAHLEAIEALRLLPDVQYPTVITRVARWLLYALAQTPEIVQICALDSLSYLIWQAHLQHRRAILDIITQEILQSGTLFQLLASSSAWVRQRTIELLSILEGQLYNQRITLLEMLHHDIDSSVRACIASTLGQSAALWAIPDLLLALLDSDETVAEAALHTLGILPLLDDGLVIYAVQEIASYKVPICALQERYQIARAARIWLKKRYKVPHKGARRENP
jgi:HEAT repeat protein